MLPLAAEWKAKMKESIYTIPISEVFEPKCGCPLCALENRLESRWVDYITGAAMMEPDVREKTNVEGFCRSHFDMMLAQRNRLAVGLILQSHLAQVQKDIEDAAKAAVPSPFAWKAEFARKTEVREQGCFVCGRIAREFSRMLSNLCAVYGREEGFRTLYAQQELLCMRHFYAINDAARPLRTKEAKELREVSAKLALGGLASIREDIDSFCMLFDYRNAGSGPAPENIASSIERAIAFLCGYEAMPEDGKGQ